MMKTATPKNILIAGIGNIFLGDDAFGSEVARRMLPQPWPEHVSVVDFGIRGIDLAYALMDGYDVTILIDATPRGGAPGTLYLIELDTETDRSAASQAIPPLQMHGLDPEKVLGLVGSLGGRLGRVLLVGCEPAPLPSEEDRFAGLSPAVDQALHRAIDLIKSLVDRLQRGQPLGGDRPVTCCPPSGGEAT